MSLAGQTHETKRVHDVIVVGAGPVGLSLALGLARRGRSVLVLEKEEGTAEHSRAPGIWPRTLEIFRELGVVERFLDEGLVMRRLEIFDADRERTALVLPFDEDLEGDTRYPHLLVLPQADTERILCEAVREHESAEVRFCAEVVGVEERGKSVLVTSRRGGREHVEQAQYVVGCDGAHSVVRDLVGEHLHGITYPVQVALADVSFAEAAALPSPRISLKGALAIGIPMPEKLWRLILPFREEEQLSLDERVRRAVRHLFGVDRYQTVWQSEFRLHCRMVKSFVRGRVALAGDAAHLNSPAGAQGMNAGIQDAEVLVPALVEALDQDAPAALVAYDRRRRREVRRVQRFTDRLTKVLLTRRGRLLRPLLDHGGVVLRLRPLRRRVVRRMAMLPRRRPRRLA